MGKFKPFLFGAILGAGIAVCALQFHVVQSHEGVRVVPRTPQASLGLAYIDVRGMTAEQYADRPEVVRALVANGLADLVAGSVRDNIVDSVTAESSSLDELRNYLNSAPASDTNHPETESSPGLFRLPASSAPATSTPAISVDEMFSLPLPTEARQQSSTGRAAAATTNGAPRMAQRDLPDINDVLGSTSGLNGTSKSTFSTGLTGGGGTGSSTTTAKEAELLEGMLFGGEESTSGSASDAEFGVFEDISSQLESRAESALRRARSGFQQESVNAANDSVGTMNKYVRGRVSESLPDTVSNAFSGGFGSGTTTTGNTTDRELPAALKALREGFDPFVE